MEFVDEEIRQLIAMIWEAILELPIDIATSDAEDEPRMMSACVQITGAWEGAVSLACGESFAARAAEIMFGLGSTPASTPDMQDAVGELANMIGGNIKALLPEPCQLSLPAVVEGAEFSIRIPHSKVVMRMPFECAGSPIRVVMVEKDLEAV